MTLFVRNYRSSKYTAAGTSKTMYTKFLLALKESVSRLKQCDDIPFEISLYFLIFHDKSSEYTSINVPLGLNYCSWPLIVVCRTSTKDTNCREVAGKRTVTACLHAFSIRNLAQRLVLKVPYVWLQLTKL